MVDKSTRQQQSGLPDNEAFRLEPPLTRTPTKMMMMKMTTKIRAVKSDHDGLARQTDRQTGS